MDTGALTQIQSALLAWFASHRRLLPFRRDRTPYQVLVAEVMSQQTQAEAVGPYLLRFLQRFPDVPALAASNEQEVLALWQGLGYYSRARHLHQAAAKMMRDHQGQVPADPVALRALPGVGPYIAAAVASFAFGADVAAFDANAMRVLSRLLNLDRADAALAQSLVPPGCAAEWNEAVMDLGALVCVPRAPRCAVCPLVEWCEGHRAGRVARLPVRPAKRPRPECEVTMLVIRDHTGRFGLVQRPARGLLAGMWEFPNVEDAVGPEAVAARHGLRLDAAPAPLPQIRHVFTHRIWNVQPYRALGSGPIRWVAVGELPDVPLGGPSARVATPAGALASPPK